MLYTDVLTTVIMTVWLSNDSRGVDSQWWLPQTDRLANSLWPTVQVGYTLITQPPIQRLEDCQLTVTVCLSVCPQELSISYGEHLLADKRYEEAGLGIIKQWLFVLCVQEYLDPSEIFVLFLKLMFFSFFFSVFTRCGAHEQALSSFQKSGNWRQVFCMASLLHYTDEEVISLARTVAGTKVTLPSHPLQSSLPNIKDNKVRYCQESFLFAMII